jgi:hypothetical protein
MRSKARGCLRIDDLGSGRGNLRTNSCGFPVPRAWTLGLAAVWNRGGASVNCATSVALRAPCVAQFEDPNTPKNLFNTEKVLPMCPV